jgi:hypothetical protein
MELLVKPEILTLYIYGLAFGNKEGVCKESPQLGEKPARCLFATVSLTWTDPGSNPRIHRERPTTIHLNHYTDLTDKN